MEPSRYSNGGSGKTLDQITAPHLYAVAYARDTIQAMKSALAPGLLKFSGFPFQDKSLPLSSKKYVCHFSVTDTNLVIILVQRLKMLGITTFSQYKKH